MWLFPSLVCIFTFSPVFHLPGSNVIVRIFASTMCLSNPPGTTFVPGTVLLIDGEFDRSLTQTLAQGFLSLCAVDTTLQPSGYASTKPTGIVLIPPPSDDPNDPLVCVDSR